MVFAGYTINTAKSISKCVRLLHRLCAVSQSNADMWMCLFGISQLQTTLIFDLSVFVWPNNAYRTVIRYLHDTGAKDEKVLTITNLLTKNYWSFFNGDFGTLALGILAHSWKFPHFGCVINAKKLSLLKVNEEISASVYMFPILRLLKPHFVSRDTVEKPCGFQPR